MKIERLNAMEQYILKNHSVSLDKLSSTFHVSINTVRRDLNTLLERGNIKKVYGGVCASPKSEFDSVPPMSVRTSENSLAKQIIGRLAADLVQDNSSIFLDSGSTTEKLIPFLAEKENVTVVTHSLSAMYEASKYPSIRLVGLGGIYNPDTVSFVGLSTSKGLSGMQIDTVFISASSISFRGGLANNNYFEAEIKSTVISQNIGKSIVAMVDSSKFSKMATFSFCPISSLSAIITDTKPAPEILKSFAAQNVKCIFPDDSTKKEM